MTKELICIGCPLGCRITVRMGEDSREGRIEVTGNTCKKGEEYAVKEVTNPTRIVTSTVRVTGGELPMVPVKTASDIPKAKIFECMREIKRARISAPVAAGDVIVKNVAETGIDVIATKSLRSHPGRNRAEV